MPRKRRNRRTQHKRLKPSLNTAHPPNLGAPLCKHVLQDFAFSTAMLASWAAPRMLDCKLEPCGLPEWDVPLDTVGIMSSSTLKASLKITARRGHPCCGLRLGLRTMGVLIGSLESVR